ncbi:MAG: hypothetical protein A2527_13505 [Candidatus Lambdaproteobacteria bacterium RIFOXYD2_FULL_50_16]|uniref:Trk system potassium uptake protein TrkA n=1 Tax=Candidatus Lambdaproteobacteria bacterium RIFOXYD2_FULL_50_16 TaxID=1817772 RepID=A0A1F6G568_9PROT|nr:MAG: hypothetical protein A2527_13505 [Candidatus Lambdaproteobacteria bacterium RIFOXYD2_FULL_50_16]
MKIVIAGAGEVGYNLIDKLAAQGARLWVVDRDAQVLEKLSRKFSEVTVDCANLVDSRFLTKTHLKDADLFLAITNSDEINMIACKMASSAGAKRTVCRIRSIQLKGAKREESLKSLGIDHIINPVELAANELFHLVSAPYLVDTHEFDQGNLSLIGYRIQEFCNIVGQSISKIEEKLASLSIKPGLVVRQDRAFLPDGRTLIEDQDLLYFFCPTGMRSWLRGFLGYAKEAKGRKNIMINGGGHIGFKLATMLENTHHRVKVIERDRMRSHNIAGRLTNAMVLNMDGTDRRKLLAEGLDEQDFFVSLTPREDVNMAACLIAKAHSNAKTICLVKQAELTQIIAQGTLIDLAISPRLLTARSLIRFVHAGSIESYFSHGHTAVMQLRLNPKCPCVGKRLGELALPKSSTVAVIGRKGHYILPGIKTEFEAGDLVFLIQHDQDKNEVMSFFSPAEP